ncbi:MAG: hypothetical protein GX228_00210 [Firmicutes bacterium]|jgi:hypothetical protein|nr:hypothetical protein [Bacillota bacterium]NLL87338.1 hypothetical protein [Bacillota bacterium]HKM17375.1 hypothetical protein [Limnochordia bacterium]
MGLFEELERVRLKFIAVCEQLLAKGLISEGQFEQILVLLDNLDEYEQQYINQKLNELTNGKLDLLFWEQDSI